MTQPALDARSRLRSLAHELREAALAVLWRQWRAVGGQAAAKGGALAIVDPEALVLLSLTLERDEPRLTDILQGWASFNSDLVSVQRANNLAIGYPDATRKRLAWFGRVALEEGKDPRWSPLASSISGRRGPATGEQSPRSNKLRAVRARLHKPAELMLRLRLGFGVGAKADVLCFLLGIEGQWATVREIATATAYTVAAVRRATDDMAWARLVASKAGPPTAYRADRRAWSGVLGLDEKFPAWRSWHERFAFVAAFLAWASDAQGKALSEYAFGVNGRELLEQHRPAFERDLVAVWSEHTTVRNGAAFVEDAVRALARWMVERA